MREGLKVYMTHIAGKPGKYPTRVQEILGKYHPEILVCGHSHILMVKRDPKFPKTLCINPGACGLHGFHKVRTAIRMEIESTIIKNMEVVEWERSSMP
jgi:predicted phosphodiesterase